MKERTHLTVTALLLSAAMLTGIAGCGAATGSANSHSGSVGDAGSGSAVLDNSAGSAGSAVPTGGLENEQEKEPDSQPESIPKGEKYIAFTFDDGPTGNTGGRTERLLDGLKERGAHATFFLCGYRIKDFNSMMNRYLAEGHEVGNHTMDHLSLTKEVSDGGLQQLQSNDDLIKSYIGQNPTVMRPTGGAYDSKVETVAKQLGLPIILWNLDTLDWKYRDAASVKSHILENAQDGAIVLEHDLYETTIVGVLAAMDELKTQGYAFVTVSELAQIKGVTLEPGKVYSDFTEETLHPDTATCEETPPCSTDNTATPAA